MATGEMWIVGGVLYTQNDQRKVTRANLHIKNGKIEQITSRLPRKRSQKVKILDAQGLTILPGFVQTHVHLCQTLFRNQADDLELMEWLSKKIWVMEAAHTEETLHTSALWGIYELLSSGTTCILDMGTVRHTHTIFEAVETMGIRASVGKCLMDHPSQTPPHLRESTQAALREAIALYKTWNGKKNDRIRVSYAPRFVISCTEALLKSVAELSREQNAIIHTHASENRKEIELVQQLTGVANIEYFKQIGLTSPRLVLAHCIWLNTREKEILKNDGVKVVHCPSSNLKLASGIAPVPELRSAGICVSLGADGAPCNNNLNMLQEIRLAALLHKPGHGPTTLRAMEALDMATREGAKALDWFDSIGSIELGKKADLIAIDLHTPSNAIYRSDILNPEAIASSIAYATQSHHICWTMVDGKLVFHKGKVAVISSDSLLNQVFRAQKKILKY